MKQFTRDKRGAVAGQEQYGIGDFRLELADTIERRLGDRSLASTSKLLTQSIPSVSMKTSATALTVTPNRPLSSASARVNPINPALAAE